MDHQEKIRQLQAMAIEDPGNELTWFMLGSEQLAAGQYPEAAESLKRCLALSPDHTAAIRKLADSYRQMGELDQARASYQAAIDKAEETGDLQVAREARAFLKKLDNEN